MGGSLDNPPYIIGGSFVEIQTHFMSRFTIYFPASCRFFFNPIQKKDYFFGAQLLLQPLLLVVLFWFPVEFTAVVELLDVAVLC
jgi:hypothetical protein